MSVKWCDTSLSHTYEKVNGPTDSEVKNLGGDSEELLGSERGSRGRISDPLLLELPKTACGLQGSLEGCHASAFSQLKVDGDKCEAHVQCGFAYRLHVTTLVWTFKELEQRWENPLL